MRCEERGDYWHFERDREQTKVVQLRTADTYYVKDKKKIKKREKNKIQN